MNCRDFINEFEDRNALGETATLHLNDCADCKKINGVQTRVWQIIDRFEPVAAPKDFDFRVKARIANAKPGDFQSRFLPVLRYVLPLSVVGLILAFVIFNGFYSFDNKTVPQVAETNFQPTIRKENSSAGTSPNEQIAINNSRGCEWWKTVADKSVTKQHQSKIKKNRESLRRRIFVAVTLWKKTPG